MIPFLEKNEGLVTWVQVFLGFFLAFLWGSDDCLVSVQPRGGTVTDQYPVMQIDGKYYTMSLRMMKAVWFVSLCT